MRPTSCPNSSISANVVSTGGPSSPKPHAANAVTHWPNFIFASSVSFTDLRASLLMLVSSLNVLKFPTNRGSIAQPAKSQNPNPPSPRNVKVRSCTLCELSHQPPIANAASTLRTTPAGKSETRSRIAPGRRAVLRRRENRRRGFRLRGDRPWAIRRRRCGRRRGGLGRRGCCRR